MIAIHVQIYLHLIRRVIDVSSLIHVLQGRLARSFSPLIVVAVDVEDEAVDAVG